MKIITIANRQPRTKTKTRTSPYLSQSSLQQILLSRAKHECWSWTRHTQHTRQSSCQEVSITLIMNRSWMFRPQPSHTSTPTGFITSVGVPFRDGWWRGGGGGTKGRERETTCQIYACDTYEFHELLFIVFFTTCNIAVFVHFYVRVSIMICIKSRPRASDHLTFLYLHITINFIITLTFLLNTI